MPHDAIPVIDQIDTEDLVVVVAETAAPQPDRAERAPSNRGDRGPQDRGGRDRRDDRRRGDGNRAGEERGEQPSAHRSERVEPRTDHRTEARSEQPRSEQRNYRSSYPGQYDRIVGMGDHVPDFILRSFALKASPVEEVEEAVTGTEG